MAIRVMGLDKVIRELDLKNKKIVESVKDVLADTATAIQLEAKQGAVVATQGIRDRLSQESGSTVDLNISQRIDKVVEKGGLTWKVGLQAADPNFEIEAWLEFGTGLSAREILGKPEYTPEIRSLARLFYRNGKGTIIGKPYLFPAYFRNTANLVQEIKDEINKVTG